MTRPSFFCLFRLLTICGALLWLSFSTLAAPTIDAAWQKIEDVSRRTAKIENTIEAHVIANTEMAIAVERRVSIVETQLANILTILQGIAVAVGVMLIETATRVFRVLSIRSRRRGPKDI